MVSFRGSIPSLPSRRGIAVVPAPVEIKPHLKGMWARETV